MLCGGYGPIDLTGPFFIVLIGYLIRIGEFCMTGYRAENLFGDGVTDPVEVIAYEVTELGNLDIPETISRYPSDTQGFWKALANELIDPDEETIKSSARRFLKGRNYCKWVCKTKQDVIDVYGSADDGMTLDDIEEIEIPDSALILSDLGKQCVLYCWKK